MPQPLYSPERELVPTIKEAGWAPGPAWMGMENLIPHWDSISRPSSPYKALFPLYYCGPQFIKAI